MFINRFIQKVVLATFAFTLCVPVGVIEASCAGGSCKTTTVTRSGPCGSRSRTKTKCKGGRCVPVCVPVQSCGPNCGPVGQMNPGMGYNPGMDMGGGSSFLNMLMAFLSGPGSSRLSASFSYKKKGRSPIETLLLIMLIKKMMDKDSTPTVSAPPQPYTGGTHGVQPPQGRPVAPVPYPSTTVSPKTSMDKALQNVIMSYLRRPKRTIDSYQELAQERANAMARNQFMPGNHAIAGAPERPGNVFEGIGYSQAGTETPTCVGPGSVIADASAVGADGNNYRVRFYY